MREENDELIEEEEHSSEEILVVNDEAEPVNYKTSLLSVLKLSFPFTLNNYAFAIASILEGVIVYSRLTEKEIAATSLIEATSGIVGGISGALLLGTAPRAAQYFSQKKFKEAGSVLQQSWTLGLISFVPSATLYACSGPIFNKLSQDKDTVALAYRYLLLMIFSLPFTKAVESDVLFLNSINRAKSVFVLNLISELIGLALTYVLITEKLGLQGLAYSNLTKAVLSFIFFKLFLTCGKDLQSFQIFNLRLRTSVKELKQLFLIGYPITFMNLISVPISLFTKKIMPGWVGDTTLALNQVIEKAITFFTPIADSITQATGIKVAEASGRNNVTSVKRYSTSGLLMNILYTSIAFSLFLALYRQLFSVFSPEGSQNFGFSDEFILLAFCLKSISQPLYYSAYNCVTNLRSLENYDVLIPTVIDAAITISIGITFSYILGVRSGLGLAGFYASDIMKLIGLNIGWYSRWNKRTSETHQCTNWNRFFSFFRTERRNNSPNGEELLATNDELVDREQLSF